MAHINLVFKKIEEKPIKYIKKVKYGTFLNKKKVKGKVKVVLFKKYFKK